MLICYNFAFAIFRSPMQGWQGWSSGWYEKPDPRQQSSALAAFIEEPPQV